MDRKRNRGVVELSSSDDSGNDDCSQLPSVHYEPYKCVLGTDGVYEGVSASKNATFDKMLYEKCLIDYQKIKKIKSKLEMSLRIKDKKQNVMGCSKLHRGCAKSVSSSNDLDDVFCEKLESACGCKLPLSLKIKISQLIEKHHFNCGASFNLDLLSLGNVSKEFEDVFSKLMRHVCTVDLRSKDLILDVLQAISECEPSMRDDNLSPAAECQDIVDVDPVFPPDVKGPVHKSSQVTRVVHNHCSPCDLVLKNSNKCCNVGVLKSNSGHSNAAVDGVSNAAASVRNPLADRSNYSSPCNNPSDVIDDVILIDKENVVVPDSVSPSPLRPGQKLFRSKLSECSHKGSLFNKDQDDLFMSTAEITPNLSKRQPLLSQFHSSGRKPHVPNVKDYDTSPVLCTGSISFAEKLKFDTKKLDAMYNSKMDTRRMMSNTAVAGPSGLKDSLGGKAPAPGPRRMFCPSRSVGGDKFHVSKSEIENYKAVCSLSSSHFSNLDVLNLGGVRCTFWSLGESLRPGGDINNFVVACFCYHLFSRPIGHPHKLKCHYFFPNVSDNLLKDHDDADVNAMSKAFNFSSKGRLSLVRSDLLYFPTCYEDHWFIFVVNNKDKQFVFLDPFYSEEDAYQQFVREKMITEFNHWWDQFVKYDKGFIEYGVKYPSVPKHTSRDSADSGVYAMMFLEHWPSPGSPLVSLFSSKDIPNIRIKICNDMLFNPRNTGDKDLVISYLQNQDYASD